VLFATHPQEAERQQTLETQAAAYDPAGRDAAPGPLRQAIAPYRQDWLEDELKRRKFGESLALLTRLCQADPQDGLACYFLGETYRLRNDEGDQERALVAYAKAGELPGAPPEVHRAMGRQHRKAGRTDEMKEAYSRYLQLKPDADDADMIRSYLEEPK
jgi:cytochrome c-type biogenesis protein CcmH/NrfG